MKIKDRERSDKIVDRRSDPYAGMSMDEILRQLDRELKGVIFGGGNEPIARQPLPEPPTPRPRPRRYMR